MDIIHYERQCRRYIIEVSRTDNAEKTFSRAERQIPANYHDTAGKKICMSRELS